MPGFDVQTLSYVLVGIAVGSVYAMAALGLVFTYKATGVFNFAHAPVSILVAYVFWQTRTGWGWPLVVYWWPSRLVQRWSPPGRG